MHALERMAIESAGLNPVLAGRLRDRRLRVGPRAALLGLHVLPYAVLADLREYSERDGGFHAMGRGTIHVTLWVDGDPWDVLDTVEDLVLTNTPSGARATFEVRRARWWHRRVSQWRVVAGRARAMLRRGTPR